MRKAKKGLAIVLAGVMMMGTALAFSPAPKVEANNFCHGGAAAIYIGLADNVYHTHIENGAKVKYQGKIYKCVACNQLSIVCPRCDSKIG